MFSLRLHPGLLAHSRVAPMPAVRTSGAEIAILAGFGAVAALLSVLDLGLQMPGHAIMRSVTPMALGMAMVPRRRAGAIMGGSALVTASLLEASGAAHLGVGALARAPGMAGLFRASAGGSRQQSDRLGRPRAAEAARPRTRREKFRVLVAAGGGHVSALGSRGRHPERHRLVPTLAAAPWPDRGAMIYVGLDDTDVVGSPGTNQLARRLIGALAAVGLAATGDDGRVIAIGAWPDDLSGSQPIETLAARGVKVRRAASGTPIGRGRVHVGKRLRPNYRGGEAVLYVRPGDVGDWEAVRIT